MRCSGAGLAALGYVEGQWGGCGRCLPGPFHRPVIHGTQLDFSALLEALPMSQNPPLAELAAQLQVEEAPDPRALLQSNASKHHDRAIGAFFDAPSPEALALLLARAKDSSPVLHPGLGGRPVLGVTARPPAPSRWPTRWPLR